MSRSLIVLSLIPLMACTHTLQIDNYARTPVSAVSVQDRLTVGVINGGGVEYGDKYIASIVRALQEQPNVENVIYPYSEAFEPDVIVRIGLNPQYKGAGSNFWVNFPGFLVFAPAWNGYKYQANPKTQVSVATPDGATVGEFNWEHNYVFHQADMGRTWTEVSWLEVGIIAFIGGIVFTGYDEDQTPEFIRAVGTNYGQQIAIRISDTLQQVERPQPVDDANPVAESQGAMLPH